MGIRTNTTVEVTPDHTTLQHQHDRRQARSKEGRQAQGPRRPPQVLRHDRRRHRRAKDRTGSSRQAILKYVCANYKVDAAKAGQHLRMALKAGIKKGSLKMAKESGKGAGKFKLVKVEKPKKKAAPKKKPAAKKAKKPAAKKAAKKPAAKEAAKKPAKKAAKAAKKPAAKKPAAKKAAKPAKKAAPKKKAAAKK